MIGGLFGALFNQANTYLTLYRRALACLSHRYGRFMEVLVITSVMASLSFWLSYYVGTCVPRQGPYAAQLISFYCAPDEYNDLASLFIVPFSTSFKQLLHFTHPESFTVASLLTFFLSFYAMACWTYGVAVPSGMMGVSIYRKSISF